MKNIILTQFLKEFSPYIIVYSYFIFIALFILLNKNFRHILMVCHKDSSEYSWLRVMTSFIVSSTVVIILVQVLTNEVNIILITTLLGISFGGKVIQKHTEGMFGKKSEITDEKKNNIERNEEK